MAKRPNPRSVRAARSYTLQEAADAIGVSIGTVRGWIRTGLPAFVGRRPFLIVGSDLQAFLQNRRAKSKIDLSEDEFFCLRCKLPRKPFGMLVDLHLQSAKTARLVGLCEVCSTPCNKMVSRRDRARIGQIFDVAGKVGSQA